MSERNKFLTEVMGRCWHLFPVHAATNTAGGTQCVKCKKWYDSDECFNLSTWNNFGQLYEWAQSQEYMNNFMGYETANYLINPDRFANAVYEFLKEYHEC